ncbi:hypothetical protein T552_02336 [Pneumocystis carinii B80]|uniref:Protein YOP1 n=1 Tax=Pneumocystis carinii (strain B80) TaxID=1408658 RepID=A0A0W4ZG48_PNEC8|nr:hypothetical protein T552_02336 [Pneumocystis carinii B80]KTW27357.1 hypothetical protein T552_02336 [Pneumocystis carinii B80]
MSFQDKLQAHVSRLDKELSQYSYLNQFERQWGIKKVYAVGAVIGLYFFLIFINVGGRFLSNILGCIIPMYYSVLAIESSNKANNIQWLSYWVIYGFLILIEHYEQSLLYWLPFYYFFKSIFILYLSLPQFNGAQTIYWTFFHPIFIKYCSKATSTTTLVSTGAPTPTPTPATTLNVSEVKEEVTAALDSELHPHSQ